MKELPIPRGRRGPVRRVLDPLQDFLHAEAAGGIVLVVAAITAVIWANSAFAESYIAFWGRDLSMLDKNDTITTTAAPHPPLA